MMKDKPCQNCNVMLFQVIPYRLYCDDCRKQKRQESLRRYDKSPKGKASQRRKAQRFSRTEKGKAARIRAQAKKDAKGKSIVQECKRRGVPFAYAVPDYWNQRIIEEQRMMCAHPDCQETDKLQSDHKISRTTLLKWGVRETRINNIQFLCSHHNFVKATRNINYHPKWLQDKLNYLDACFEQMERCA